MKKTRLIILSCITAVCLFICGCAVGLYLCSNSGNVKNVEILDYSSDIYTDEEIEEAINVTKNYFKKEFEGCKLLEITYIGDDKNGDYQEFAQRYNADDVIVLISSFYVNAWGANGSLNPDFTYEGWMWILVRSNNGEWVHVDHGY